MVGHRLSQYQSPVGEKVRRERLWTSAGETPARPGKNLTHRHREAIVAAPSRLYSRIWDHVGGVKHFLNTLPHALEEEPHFALSEKQFPMPTNSSLVINSGQDFEPTHASLRSKLRS